MKDFIWKASKREVNVMSLFNDPWETFYIPEETLPELSKVDCFSANPAKYKLAKVKYKRVSKYVAEENKGTGFVIEAGAKYIIPLYLIYLRVTGCGNDPIFKVVKSVALEDGIFTYELGSDEASATFSAWVGKVRDFVDSNVEDSLEKSGQEPYKNVDFDAEVEDTIYEGKILEMEVSENMSVAEFREEAMKIIGAIPYIFFQKKCARPNMQLKEIGVKGTSIVKIEPYLTIGEVNRTLKKQLSLTQTEFYFKYVDRSWSYILGAERLNDLNNLPSIWTSIGSNILFKIVNWVNEK